MNIDDLPALLQKLQDHGKQNAAFEALFSEISTALADVLHHMETSGPQLAQSIADALRGMKLEIPAPHITVAAPNVTVEAPKVTVEAPIVNVPEMQTVVHVMEKPGPVGWEFECFPQRGGGMRITAKRVNEPTAL